MKDMIFSVVRALIEEGLDTSKNWMTDYRMLGRGNPKYLLTKSELIIHMI